MGLFYHFIFDSDVLYIEILFIKPLNRLVLDKVKGIHTIEGFNGFCTVKYQINLNLSTNVVYHQGVTSRVTFKK